MIAFHCSGHRLELAYKDAIKKFPLAEKVVTLLSGLFYMYRNSPLNRKTSKMHTSTWATKYLCQLQLEVQDGLDTYLVL